MKKKIQQGALVVLALILVLVWMNTLEGPTGVLTVFTGSDSENRFVVQNPSLRLDLLKETSKPEYAGMFRNIFSSTPLPPPVDRTPKPAPPPVDPGPPPAPVDPPLVPPFKFYGYVSDARSTRLRGFFTAGDDIIVAAEGDTIQRRFKLVRLTTSRAEVEEISSGKRAILQLDESAAPSSAN